MKRIYFVSIEEKHDAFRSTIQRRRIETRRVLSLNADKLVFQKYNPEKKD